MVGLWIQPYHILLSGRGHQLSSYKKPKEQDVVSRVLLLLLWAQDAKTTAYVTFLGWLCVLSWAEKSSSQISALRPLVPAGTAIYCKLSHCLQSTFHCSGWGLKRKHVRLFFQGSAVHDPPSTQQAACAAFPAADILRVEKTPLGFSLFLFPSPLLIFHNSGHVSFLRPSAGNFTSLSCCYCRDLQPSARPWAFLLFSYSTA